MLHGRDLGPGDGDVDERGRRWRRPATTTRPPCSCPTAACSWPAAATTTAAAGPGQFSAQFYSPPYLFNGSRPTITNAPAATTYGSTFTVTTPDAASIRSVNLVSLGADTHQSDMDQHFVPLSFTAGAGSLTVQAPAAAALAPPGTYMLFIVDDKGVPSVASMVGMSRTLGAPATPAKPTATAGDGQATVSWSAPDDGGSTITKYTVTPYIGATAQTPKDVTGSPAATSTTISGLTNGTAYTFKVSATNAVGTSAQSAASDPVTPTAPVAGALAFVQQVNKRGVAASLALQPTAAVTTGNRLIVQVGVWSYGNATASGVTDSAGNTYTKLTSVKASDATELSVWSAPITAGGGTQADGHRHDHGQRRHRCQRARVLGAVDRRGDRRRRSAQDRDGDDVARPATCPQGPPRRALRPVSWRWASTPTRASATP